MQHQTTWPTVPFSAIDLSSDNPVPAILNGPKFSETETVIYNTAASRRSLISAASAALIYTLVRNAKPQHVVEIGTYHGGTAEVICQALHENGSGILHLVDAFDYPSAVAIFELWPQELRRHLELYSMYSMDFYYRLNARGIRPEIAIVDGDHSYQAALFDIQSLAKSLTRRGFLLIHDISEPGPYYAAMDFLQRNPGWTRCKAREPKWADPNKAFDRERSTVPETNFEILRAPRGYDIGSRPVTFGELPSANTVRGLRIHAETGGGTLHVQCALRGFPPGADPSAWRLSILRRPARSILCMRNHSDQRIVNRCSAELGLAWSGETPLIIAEIPTLIS